MLLRDADGRNFRLPGRVTRTLTDPCMTGALASWQTKAAGTTTFESFGGASVMGRNKLATGEVSGNAAAVKTASPLNSIKPANFLALMLTLEGFTTDADTGMDLTVGFHPESGTKGGCELIHLNGNTKAKIRAYNESGETTDDEINWRFFAESGGGRKRRNLSFLLLPRGYGGLYTTPWAYVLEDDQVVAGLDLSGTHFDKTLLTVGIWQITTREAKAHTMYWSQVSLTLNHN